MFHNIAAINSVDNNKLSLFVFFIFFANVLKNLFLDRLSEQNKCTERC